MHKLKTTARHHAWNTSGTGTNYNPFGRVRSRSSQIAGGEDVERGITDRPLNHGDTFHSENCVEPESESRRRSQYGEDNIGPTHANTMPVSRGQDRGLNAVDPPIGGRRKENSEESNAQTSDTLVTDDLPQANGHPSQGKFGGILGKMHLKKDKKEKEKAEPARSNTSGSKRKFTPWNQIQATLFNSWINVLLVAVPVGIALHFVPGMSKVVIFVVNFIAIIPLAALLSYATEEIALRTSEVYGGLLNATFGNAVELIVSIIALVKNETIIVKTSLIGSVLSNLLLVLGMCFFFGGLNRVEQHFNVVVAQTAASLLALAIGALIIPTAFFISGSGKIENIDALSRGTAVLLLVVYGAYLFFQLKTHAIIYNKPSEKAPKRRVKTEKGDASNRIAQMGANMAGGGADQENFMHQDEEEKEEPALSLVVALITLAGSTALVGVCAEFLVDSIDAITASSGISKTFVGLILLPIVGNAAEHATAVTVAIKDKMDLAIGVAVGSSLQISLGVLPLSVVLGWIIGRPDMNLEFDGFQISVLFVAVLLVNYLIADGKSHWLEGTLLSVLYIIIAIAAWFYDSGQ